MSGTTQQGLASQLQLSRNKIASYESGLVEPNTKNFMKVCTHFQVLPREMLDAQLSISPAESVHVDTTELNTQDKKFISRFDEFIAKTNEMSKIWDGYDALLNVRIEENEGEIKNEYFQTYKEILELLQLLLKTNWNLISQVYPFDESSLEEE